MYEIEHKYLVDVAKFDEFLSKNVENDVIAIKEIKQGYVIDDSQQGILRVRIINGGVGLLTFKRSTGDKAKNVEVETSILIDEAEFLFNSCDRRIAKTRYVVNVDGRNWEVDKFGDRLEGFVMAEVEIPNENTPYTKPNWVTKEVTQDGQFSNYNLSKATGELLAKIA